MSLLWNTGAHVRRPQTNTSALRPYQQLRLEPQSRTLQRLRRLLANVQDGTLPVPRSTPALQAFAPLSTAVFTGHPHAALPRPTECLRPPRDHHRPYTTVRLVRPHPHSASQPHRRLPHHNGRRVTGHERRQRARCLPAPQSGPSPIRPRISSPVHLAGSIPRGQERCALLSAGRSILVSTSRLWALNVFEACSDYLS
jgi:hypothetical protein